MSYSSGIAQRRLSRARLNLMLLNVQNVNLKKLRASLPRGLAQECFKIASSEACRLLARGVQSHKWHKIFIESLRRPLSQ